MAKHHQESVGRTTIVRRCGHVPDLKRSRIAGTNGLCAVNEGKESRTHALYAGAPIRELSTSKSHVPLISNTGITT